MEKELEEYIASKLDNIIKPMIAASLKNRPKNVAEFMLNWVQENSKPKTSTDDNSESEDSIDVLFSSL